MPNTSYLQDLRKGCKRRLRERNKHLVLESGAEVSDSGSESDGQAWFPAKGLKASCLVAS